MPHLVHELRTKHQIPGLCQVLIGSIRPYTEEGIERHYVHHATGAATFTRDGKLAPESRGNLAIVTEFGRQTGINRFMEDEKGARPYRAPQETVVLSMPLEGPGAARRAEVLVEASDQLHEVMFAGTPLPMVVVTRQVMIGKNCVVRHHLVAVFDDFRRPFWVHPALARFGLGKIPFPPTQKHRDLGPISGWMDPPDSEVFEQDRWGYPRWYTFSLALEGRIPVHPEEDFWVSPVDRKIPDIIRLASHQMLTNFEAFFGRGTLVPARLQGRPR